MEAIPAFNDQDLLSFSYNGSMWCLQTALYNIMDKITVGLINTNIECIEIENTLNDLIIKGSLTYVDLLGKVDKILSEAYSMCIIRFWKKEGKSTDDNIPFKIGSEEMVFEHMFLILNVKILSRQKNIIKYKLDLVSQYWQNCNMHVSYTNYDLKKSDLPPISEIIKTVLTRANFKIDVDSFNDNITGTKIQYISNANDTPMTIVNYLFRRLFYEYPYLETTRFLAYNMILDKIYLIDLSKGDSHLASSTIVMSCFDNSIENMINLNSVQLASLNKVTKTDFFKTFETRYMYKYTENRNTIDPSESSRIQSCEIVSHFLNTFKDNNEEYHNKMTTNIADAMLKCEDLNEFVNTNRFECYWNNKSNLYDEIVQSFLYNDSIVLNVGGQIHQNAGSFVGITIDRTFGEKSNMTDGDNARNIKERYKKFEGIWLVAKCRHIIEPMKQKFTTNLTLNRNFTPKIKYS